MALLATTVENTSRFVHASSMMPKYISLKDTLSMASFQNKSPMCLGVENSPCRIQAPQPRQPPPRGDGRTATGYKSDASRSRPGAAEPTSNTWMVARHKDVLQELEMQDVLHDVSEVLIKSADKTALLSTLGNNLGQTSRAYLRANNLRLAYVLRLLPEDFSIRGNGPGMWVTYLKMAPKQLFTGSSTAPVVFKF
eukprot:TRINITY_DN34949_c0_g1_i1.p2 TRINITY_DN34949_c0_g1~~TRINITY_DN34949_c0_g1_i1.p2  ORF type:complete len:195 (-),score=23.55 TRINITY_DN34949_c0_g1_i1:172-756(-)